MHWIHRGSGTGGNPAHDSFDGILLQEWSVQNGLIGPVKNIYSGTSRGLTEAPHLFKRNGYYYLTTAEGGTGYSHAVSLARSRSIEGPYEDHPDLHVICAADAPDHPIQRTGHGQYVEAPDGAVYHTFLMGRPLTDASGEGRYCPMGRETGVERCVWRDDWLYLEAGGLLPRVDVPHSANTPKPQSSIHESFGNTLPIEFQWLRTPHPERLFRLEAGKLILTGRESIGSWFEQSLVARRQEHTDYNAQCTLDFRPDIYQQAAGLTTYYNRFKFHAAMITQTPNEGRVIEIYSCLGDYPEGRLNKALERPVSIPDGLIDISVEVRGNLQQFYWSECGGRRQALGPKLPAYIISDEGGRGEHASFTGAFVGMLAFDISGHGKEACFNAFSYIPTQSGDR